MKPLRFALMGAGYWSQFQLAGWQELAGVQCAAIYNRTRAKAEALGARFGVSAIFDDPARLLDEVDVDFVDIVTDVQSSIVACNADLLRGLLGEEPAETTGADNLRTVRLVFAAYESSAKRQTIVLT